MDVTKTEKAPSSGTFLLARRQKDVVSSTLLYYLAPRIFRPPSNQWTAPLFTEEQALSSSCWAPRFVFGSRLFPTLRASCSDGADPHPSPRKVPWQLVQRWAQPTQLKSVILEGCLGLCSISGEGLSWSDVDWWPSWQIFGESPEQEAS